MELQSAHAVATHPARPPLASWRRPAADAGGGAATPADGTRPIRLLVVDDDLGTIEYLGQLLKGFAQIGFATNGEDALRLAALQPPDLVMLDIEMPGIDGFEVCRRLRALSGRRHLPIVFATRHGDAATEAAALLLGADDFIRKPFADVQVLARLRTQLRSTAARAAARPVDAAGPTRILIIDDDPVSIQLVRRLLAEIGECHFALDAGRALAMARELHPDLILLDIDLPDSDGFRVCKALRAYPALAQVPLMFLTQSASLGYEARALAVGGDDFLRKPFDAPVLRARARRLVERRRAQQAPDAAGHGRLRDARNTASMLSYIAHELGNPVNVIKGFAELMHADRSTPLPAHQAAKLAHILDAVGRLSGLLADVTDVARMASGQFPVELARVEADALVRQACAQADAQAAQAGVSLRADTVPVAVRADPRRLRQCLDNLLSNAIKYGRGGRHVEVEVECRGDEVALAVQDHGPGLDDEQLAHLFEPYNRLGHDGGAIPGTGLGLALTRDLVRAMGGRLVVYGGAGRGARFELLLPRAANQD